MFKTLRQNLAIKLTNWLVACDCRQDLPSRHFDRLCHDIKAGDVLLVEGRSRTSSLIRAFTSSRWTHCALYIGRPSEIQNAEARIRLRSLCRGDPSQQLLIEAEIGKGVAVTPLSDYRQHNMQLCRPKTLSVKQRQKAIDYAVNRIGIAYDLKLLFTLAIALFWHRLFPWKEWHERLPRQSALSERTICTQLVWETMNSVNELALPIDFHPASSKPQWAQTGIPALTPKAFLYSSYFQTRQYSHRRKQTKRIRPPAIAGAMLAQISH